MWIAQLFWDDAFIQRKICIMAKVSKKFAEDVESGTFSRWAKSGKTLKISCQNNRGSDLREYVWINRLGNNGVGGDAILA
jgi:hypothetical protein